MFSRVIPTTIMWTDWRLIQSIKAW